MLAEAELFFDSLLHARATTPLFCSGAGGCCESIRTAFSGAPTGKAGEGSEALLVLWKKGRVRRELGPGIGAVDGWRGNGGDIGGYDRLVNAEVVDVFSVGMVIA